MQIVVQAELVVLLGILRLSIVGLNAVVAIEPEAIGPHNSAAVGRILLDAIVSCLFHEAAQPLR